MKKLVLLLSALILICVFPVIPVSAEATEHIHEYVYTDSGDGFMHRVSCKTCDEPISPMPHKGGTATCTKGASCVDCGAEYGTPDGHSGSASCIEEWYCDVCDTRVSGKNPDAHIYGYDVPNAEDATCLKDGYSGDTVCSACGALIKKGKSVPATGHSFKKGKCIDCGFAETTTTKKSPSTEKATTVRTTKPATTVRKNYNTATTKKTQYTTTTGKAITKEETTSITTTGEETTTLVQTPTGTEEAPETTVKATTDSENPSTEKEKDGINPLIIVVPVSLLIVAAAIFIIRKRKEA